MTVMTKHGKMVTRLRGEGSAVVVAIPKVLRDELVLKAGDLVTASAEAGAVVLRKVELREVGRASNPEVRGE